MVPAFGLHYERDSRCSVDPGPSTHGRLRLTEEAEVWAEVQAGRGRWGLEVRVIIGLRTS